MISTALFTSSSIHTNHCYTADCDVSNWNQWVCAIRTKAKVNSYRLQIH